MSNMPPKLDYQHIGEALEGVEQGGSTSIVEISSSSGSKQFAQNGAKTSLEAHKTVEKALTTSSADARSSQAPAELLQGQLRVKSTLLMEEDTAHTKYELADRTEAQPNLSEASESSTQHEALHHRTKPILNARILYHTVDFNSPNKHTLYLSNISAALPTSKLLKDHHIKSVFSIVQAAELGDAFHSMKELYGPTSRAKKILSEGLDTVVLQEEEKVLYYNLNMADISNPAILAKPIGKAPALTASDVFCRAVIFIEKALQRGNVLVHCEQGRRRSPTMIIAFLVARGSRTHQAIQMIGSEYQGDEGPEWASKYIKHRDMWIGALGAWESESRAKISAFNNDHPRLCKALEGLEWTEQDEQSLKEEQSNRKLQAEEKSNAKKRPLSSVSPSPRTASSATTAGNKKFKVAVQSIGPSLWANKKK